MSETQTVDLLEITGLAKRFAGGTGISNVSLSVPAGSITGFIGINGAGKSTTLRCVMGLLQPDAGDIRLFGVPARLSSRDKIGFLPEERGLFAYERARDTIAFHGRLKGMDRRDALMAADRLLERIGLGARKKDKLAAFSKGNAQRVQVLCALVHEPRLLLLDEPLSGLDPVAQAEMLSLLAEFRGRGGAVLFSTHSMAAAENVCDRVVMLSAGRTAFEGVLSEAFALAPHGAIVVTTDVEGLAAAASALGGSVLPLAGGIGEAGRWRVLLPREITHPALIRVLAERKVPLFAFQPVKEDLEGAFLHLVETPSAARRAA
jgi:ABC-2 type transport system ATP-binding protein